MGGNQLEINAVLTLQDQEDSYVSLSFFSMDSHCGFQLEHAGRETFPFLAFSLLCLVRLEIRALYRTTLVCSASGAVEL